MKLQRKPFKIFENGLKKIKTNLEERGLRRVKAGVAWRNNHINWSHQTNTSGCSHLFRVNKISLQHKQSIEKR